MRGEGLEEKYGRLMEEFGGWWWGEGREPERTLEWENVERKRGF